MSSKRRTYTVYCETCQQHLATYVLGRGYQKYTRTQAESRAAAHKTTKGIEGQSGHVVTVKEKA